MVIFDQFGYGRIGGKQPPALFLFSREERENRHLNPSS